MQLGITINWLTSTASVIPRYPICCFVFSSMVRRYSTPLITSLLTLILVFVLFISTPAVQCTFRPRKHNVHASSSKLSCQEKEFMLQAHTSQRFRQLQRALEENMAAGGHFRLAKPVSQLLTVLWDEDLAAHAQTIADSLSNQIPQSWHGMREQTYHRYKRDYRNGSSDPDKKENQKKDVDDDDGDGDDNADDDYTGKESTVISHKKKVTVEFTSVSGYTPDFIKIVDNWFQPDGSEKFGIYGEKLGDYIQAVWGDTNSVGCGKSQTTGETDTTQLIACSYGADKSKLSRSVTFRSCRPHTLQCGECHKNRNTHCPVCGDQEY